MLLLISSLGYAFQGMGPGPGVKAYSGGTPPPETLDLQWADGGPVVAYDEIKWEDGGLHAYKN